VALTPFSQHRPLSSSASMMNTWAPFLSASPLFLIFSTVIALCRDAGDHFWAKHTTTRSKSSLVLWMASLTRVQLSQRTSSVAIFGTTGGQKPRLAALWECPSPPLERSPSLGKLFCFIVKFVRFGDSGFLALKCFQN